MLTVIGLEMTKALKNRGRLICEEIENDGNLLPSLKTYGPRRLVANGYGYSRRSALVIRVTGPIGTAVHTREAIWRCVIDELVIATGRACPSLLGVATRNNFETVASWGVARDIILENV